ncbi:MAG: hypothetical protein JST22_12165 [Bacteroidetes bacterium]|nr:hypothetical protein [Bacteroidota bacterium]HVZ38957.1 hypothetical protein [Candidatus Kapabacteria bacterium]
MTRRDVLLRSWLLVLALLGLTALLSPNTAHAQLPCKCDYATIAVGKVPCDFKVCVKDANGLNCIGVTGGGTYKVKCNQQASFYLVDCKGNLVQIDNGKTNCVTCVCVAPGCCVDACIGTDADGCLYVKIGPSDPNTCKCP